MIILDQTSRQIIVEFYEKSKNKSALWVWWNKNIIVSNYEGLKAQRNLYRTVEKAFSELYVSKLITKLDRFLSLHFHNNTIQL
jgi:hypothetical protein